LAAENPEAGTVGVSDGDKLVGVIIPGFCAWRHPDTSTIMKEKTRTGILLIG
jgi:hypothetical protein